VDSKSSLILGASIVLASAIGAFGLSHRSAPPAAGQEPPAGRFQIAGIPGHAYVLDTATGQVWETFGAAGTGSSDGDFKSPKPKGKE
jgi:hypothetical protein